MSSCKLSAKFKDVIVDLTLAKPSHLGATPDGIFVEVGAGSVSNFSKIFERLWRRILHKNEQRIGVGFVQFSAFALNSSHKLKPAAMPKLTI